jgi:hypothetical protein
VSGLTLLGCKPDTKKNKNIKKIIDKKIVMCYYGICSKKQYSLRRLVPQPS